MTHHRLRIATLAVLLSLSAAATLWAAIRMHLAASRQFPDEVDQVVIVVPGIGVIGSAKMFVLGMTSVLIARMI